MAREYTVALPGGGFVTVNASDPAAARENAGVGPDANVQAGGHMASSETGVAVGYGGPEEYDEPQDNGGSLYSMEGAGVPDIDGGGTTTTKPKAAAAAATTGKTKGDPGSMYGYEAAGTMDPSEANRTKSIYGYREGENLEQWMQRVFRQGTRDFGGALSPETDNPYRNTPYAQWFQNRYRDVVPANMLLDRLLNNKGATQDVAPQLEGGMQDFMGSGVGMGHGTGTAGAQANLGKLNDLMNSVLAGNTGGLSEEQINVLGGLNDSPNNQLAMLMAQLSGGSGANPLSARYISNLGQQSLNDYYDDIVGKSPATNGTFLQNLMQKMNMA